MRLRAGPVLGALLAAALLAAIGLATRWGWTAGEDPRALVRLTWKIRGERVEECREPTEEELAERPPHMRRERVCEGRVVPYALSVEIDGRTAVTDIVHGAGAREDRPIAVHREIPVTPGEHAVRIRFEALGGESPDALSLERTLRLGPREVAVVTWDPDRRSLVARTP
ncbi:MAG: hypothetical protein R3199_09975 [Gemmatimonadota bacterium]|nr:hypothetical protein [Gemmatimonadota bacterium]